MGVETDEHTAETAADSAAVGGADAVDATAADAAVSDTAGDAAADDAAAEGTGADAASSVGGSADDVDDLVEEGEIAGDYLEQLLDVLDYDGDIDLDVEGDRAVVSIDGGKDLSRLVGRRGEVLDALQELTRLAVQQSTGERSRLMLDVAGWRAGKRTELAKLGRSAAERVAGSGQREELEPMTPFERKIIHDAIATIDGVTSESEGVEPKRFVVILPA
ncbi:Jag family protein [Millisia brevis]|uniref:Jag family protein n=1 Tax=Millisia brevis TaxID=264148 RepID=UPI000AE60842|nr:protein jag [Millisia brevis]